MRSRVAAGILVFLSMVFMAGGCSSEKEYSSQQFLMDTVIDITVSSGSQDKSRIAVETAFDEIKRIADLTDRFPLKGSRAYNVSDVCRVNDKAGLEPVQVGDDVLTMLELSKQYSKITGGAFDVTVGPLMDLWGFGSEQQKVPGDTLLGQKLSLVGMDKVHLDREEKTVYLSKRGMSIDLGGIAKGYAAEKAAQVLKEQGIDRGVVNAGGNVVVLGSKNRREPWRVGIQDPRNSNDLIGVLSLSGQAAVTSGDYQRFFEKNGVRYHHLLDPATGQPAREAISVTVVCDSSTRADILSTAFFVMGREQALDLANRLEGVEVIFVGPDKRITVSSGLKELVEITPGKDFSYDPQG